LFLLQRLEDFRLYVDNVKVLEERAFFVPSLLGQGEEGRVIFGH